MRYIICKNDISSREVSARMEYIYGLFHIYTLKDNINSCENTIVLKSIPNNQPDILMLVGHDPITNNYIIQNIDSISEKNIIIISCNTKKIRQLSNIKNKNIYVPNNPSKINYYNGKEFGFQFDITDEEIMLYRNKNENLDNMLKNTFERIKVNGEDN